MIFKFDVDIVNKALAHELVSKRRSASIIYLFFLVQVGYCPMGQFGMFDVIPIRKVGKRFGFQVKSRLGH